MRTLLALAGACALAVLLVAPLGWKEQAIAGGALIATAILLSRLSRARTVTLALMAVSIFCTLRYAYWRTGETWNGITSAGHLYQWDTVFVLLLLGAEFYAFATLALGYFQTLHPLRRPPVPLRGNRHDWPTVDVFFPTYNEPLDVVRATVFGALELDYPADKIKILTPPEPFAPMVYPEQTRTAPNYDIAFRADYRLTPHLHLVAFANANNTRDFNQQVVGIGLKLLGQRLPAARELSVRAIPDWRGNQPLGN
jgi:hypothetical protein